MNHHTVLDLDALEVWGPEPPSHNILAGPSPVIEGFNGGFGVGPGTADSDRFSLDNDSGSGTAIWAFNTLSGANAPWVLHSDIVEAVEKLFLGPGNRFDDETRRAIDVDALMARDINNPSPTAPPLWNLGDELLISIDPVTGNELNPNGGVVGTVTIDGGEVIHIAKIGVGPGPASISVSFLNHGGHLWDTAFPVASTFGYFFEDLDALEAVGTLTGDREIPTPEPSSLLLVLLATAAIGVQGFRRTTG